MSWKIYGVVGPHHGKNGKGWEYEVYIDANQDLKRAMNVNNVPYTFLIDGKGKIVYEHNNYVPGDENILYKKISLSLSALPLSLDLLTLTTFK